MGKNGYRKPGEPANQSTAPKCGVSRTMVRGVHPAIAAFAQIFPQKTALHLVIVNAELGREVSISFCEKLVDGRKQPGADMLEALLQSEHGDKILGAVMAGSTASWWKRLRRQVDLGALIKAQNETQRAIDAMQRELARDE